MKMTDDAFEMLYHWDDNKNKVAPVLFKDFSYRSSTMNKSYFIKKEDIEAASRVRKLNSISCLGAIRLRWEVCLPMDGREWDIKRAKTPLRDFVKELGFELYLDMDEIVDLRSLSYLRD